MNRLGLMQVALAGVAFSVALACTSSDDHAPGGSHADTATAGNGGSRQGGSAGAVTSAAGQGGSSNGGSAGGVATGGTDSGGSGGAFSGPGGAGRGGSSAGGAPTGGTGAGGSGAGRSGADGSGAGGSGAGAPSGGMSAGGSAGTGPTGVAGSSGSGVASPSRDPIPSAGCTATPTTTACDTQSSPCTADIEGTMRKWYVQLPDGYDATHPYPVVFEYHPLGGNGWQGLTMYQIRPKMPQALYVSPEGTGSGNLGFPNTGGMDEALTRKMMADLEAKYCVDRGRYFATGFSYGGSMSYTAACNMSDVFRAIGAMSGAPISGAKCTSKKPERPVAIWATHGDMDTALPITMAEPIIESLVESNGCSSETKALDPSPCLEYQGCQAGYPVVWCVREGDPHSIPSFGAQAISDFFKKF